MKLLAPPSRGERRNMILLFVAAYSDGPLKV